MTAKALPAQDYLRKLLDYDPETGKLTWRYREGGYAPWNGRFAGKPAFTRNQDGYATGVLYGKSFLAHRVIWKWFYGTEPVQIDHINGDRGDNRIVNLRNVTNAENCRNQCRRPHNTSGVTGVVWVKSLRKWKGQIMQNGKNFHLGYYDEFEQAVAARKNAEKRLGFHVNHGRAA